MQWQYGCTNCSLTHQAGDAGGVGEVHAEDRALGAGRPLACRGVKVTGGVRCEIESMPVDILCSRGNCTEEVAVDEVDQRPEDVALVSL